jgi:hypothetical protein
VGLPATAALASEGDVTTPESADAMAQHYRDQADHYRALGGVGYKTGLVQRADSDAAKYAALAEQLRAPEAAQPQSPEAAHYAELAARYRAMGGVGYKTGLVQWAEAQQQKHEAPTVSPAAVDTAHSPECTATKPVVTAQLLACSR